MAIKSFKEILQKEAKRIDIKDRNIFERGKMPSFFGRGMTDTVEFILYDNGDNQLPQGENGKLVRYINVSEIDNIRNYLMIARGSTSNSTPEYFIDVEKLIKKHKSWAYINYSGMDEEQFRKELLSYPKPAIEGSMRNIAKKKVKSILAEDFLELCRETLFRKLDAECHKDSDWYGRLPVLAVVTTTECPHHCDDAYCFLIKFIRDSD